MSVRRCQRVEVQHSENELTLWFSWSYFYQLTITIIKKKPDLSHIAEARCWELYDNESSFPSSLLCSLGIILEALWISINCRSLQSGKKKNNVQMSWLMLLVLSQIMLSNLVSLTPNMLMMSVWAWSQRSDSAWCCRSLEERAARQELLQGHYKHRGTKVDSGVCLIAKGQISPCSHGADVGEDV